MFPDRVATFTRSGWPLFPIDWWLARCTLSFFQALQRRPGTRGDRGTRRRNMKKWQRPTIVEIQVGNEINLYVCAEL